MKRIILLLNLVVASFVFAGSASALSCMQSTLGEDVNKASSIFIGRVLTVDTEKVNFQINKYWKGSLNQNQTIFGTTYWTGMMGGNIWYKNGNEYIVFTYRDQNGIERSSIDCGRSAIYNSDLENQITNILGTPKYFSNPVMPLFPNPSTNYCAYTNVSTNMWLGNWNNNRSEVRTLQNFLFNYYGVVGEVNATGFFGRLTKNYVSQFQREQGLRPVTGGVGPLTRNKMKALCNNNQDDSAGGANCKIYYDGCNTCSRQYVGGPAMCTLMACISTGSNIWNSGAYCKEYFSNNVNTSPVVKSFTGPVQLKVGEKGTWKIDASIYNNQSLSYNVTWGDEGTELYKTSAPLSMSAIFNQQTTFEHTYSRAGTFTVQVSVTSQDGQTNTTTQTVNVLQNDVAYCTSEYNPVCGQPPMPYCQPAYACIQAFPAPRTYSNICLMSKDNATLVYYGNCR